MLTINNKVCLSSGKVRNQLAVSPYAKVLTKFTAAQTVVNRGSFLCFDPCTSIYPLKITAQGASSTLGIFIMWGNWT